MPKLGVYISDVGRYNSVGLYDSEENRRREARGMRPYAECPPRDWRVSRGMYNNRVRYNGYSVARSEQPNESVMFLHRIERSPTSHTFVKERESSACLLAQCHVRPDAEASKCCNFEPIAITVAQKTFGWWSGGWTGDPGKTTPPATAAIVRSEKG